MLGPTDCFGAKIDFPTSHMTLPQRHTPSPGDMCPNRIRFDFWNNPFHKVFNTVEHEEVRVGVVVGYARTSTTEQLAGMEAQRRDLRAAGATKLFSEQVSSLAPRAELERAIDYLRDDDVFVVTKLDRLARSVADLINITSKIETKGASVRILALNLDTTTPTGKLMVNLLGSIAQFERELMLERQRDGIAKAKSEGKYKGRAPTARAKEADVFRLRDSEVGPMEIARELKIGRTSVYRILGTDQRSIKGEHQA
jgi:DNA invertase Pin-like site-specific DNA recombinase